jgi:hypothetical protein
VPHPVQALHHGIALAAESPATPALHIAAAHLAAAGRVRSCEGRVVGETADRSPPGAESRAAGRTSRAAVGSEQERSRRRRGRGAEGLAAELGRGAIDLVGGGESNATRETEVRVELLLSSGWLRVFAPPRSRAPR